MSAGTEARSGRRPAPVERSDRTGARDRARPTPLARTMMALIAGLVSLGLLSALLVLVLARTASFTTAPQILISPGEDLSASEVTSFYEALSRGQITATAAAIIAQPTIRREVAGEAGVDPDDVTVTVSVVPETTLVRMEVSAPSAAAAEEVAEVLVEVAVDEISDLLPAFDVTPLGEEVPQASPSGVTTPQIVAAGTATFVIAFLACYLALLALWRARHRRLA